MDTEFIFIRMGIFMLVNGKITNFMVKGIIYLIMGKDMKEIL